MADVNNFDPVALSIDGPRHRAELLRIGDYAATGGAEGVIAPLDCRVRSLATAGPQIRIDSGAIAIRNRSANIDNQTYIANNRAETKLDVAPTGASGRSDAVIVRVRDPQYAPWTSVLSGVADINTFPYAQPIIIQNVANTVTNATQLNLGYSAYMLARIDLPANTTNITQAMIKTQRAVTIERREFKFYRHDVAAGSGPYYSATSGTGFNKFPPTSALPDGSIYIPLYATKAIIRADITGLALVDGPYKGYWKFLLTYGGTDVYTWQVAFNEQEALAGRLSAHISDDIALPASFRGQVVSGRLTFSRVSGTGRLKADGDTQLSVDMDFYGQVAED